MKADSPDSPSFSAGRRWSVALTVMIAVLSAAAIVTMVNYLAARYYTRLVWSTRQQDGLSSRTLSLLESLTNRVHITAYFDPEQLLYGPVSALLDEYRYRCPRLTVDLVDYIRNAGAAKLIQARYDLTRNTDKDVVIFECDGRIKKVYATDLADVALEPVPGEGQREYRRRIAAFKGELQFTSAILSVLDAIPPKAYFLQGHGEHDPGSDDARQGFSSFTSVLRDNSVTAAKLDNLAALNEVPRDCRLLIIAGPTGNLLPVEVSRIERYLAEGGRALVLLNFFGQNKNIELGQLLSRWGVVVGNDRVIDRENTVNGEDLLTVEFAPHDVVRPLYQTRLHLLLPRSVSQGKGMAGGADAAKVVELVKTGARAVIATQIRDGIVYPDPVRDVQGPAPVIAAVERGAIKGISSERGTTRLLVAGDSFFLSNLLMDSAGNRDFANQAINWLLDRSRLLEGIGPRPVQEYRISLTRAQLRHARWILLVVLPGTVLTAGLVVWMRRRR